VDNNEIRIIIMETSIMMVVCEDKKFLRNIQEKKSCEISEKRNLAKYAREEIKNKIKNHPNHARMRESCKKNNRKNINIKKEMCCAHTKSKPYVILEHVFGYFCSPHTHIHTQTLHMWLILTSPL
jgi:hypothetical protein